MLVVFLKWVAQGAMTHQVCQTSLHPLHVHSIQPPPPTLFPTLFIGQQALHTSNLNIIRSARCTLSFFTIKLYISTELHSHHCLKEALLFQHICRIKVTHQWTHYNQNLKTSFVSIWFNTIFLSIVLCQADVVEYIATKILYEFVFPHMSYQFSSPFLDIAFFTKLESSIITKFLCYNLRLAWWGCWVL
jgi:hypothetical protein